MPITLEGGCRCGAVRFSVSSHTPQPFMRCYCSICRKTAGGGGYAINLGAVNGTLKVEGRDALSIYRAEIERGGVCEVSNRPAPFLQALRQRAWLYGSDGRNWCILRLGIDSELRYRGERAHHAGLQACWVGPQIGPTMTVSTNTRGIDRGLAQKKRGLWVALNRTRARPPGPGLV